MMCGSWISETFYKEKLFLRECFEQPWLQLSLSARVSVAVCTGFLWPPAVTGLCGAVGRQ